MTTDETVLARVFETSPVGVVLVAPTGEIRRANARAETLLGLERSEITNRTYDQPEWQQVDEHGDPLPPEALPISRVIQGGEPVFGVEHGLVRDGSTRWLSVNAAPIHRDGAIESVVAAFEDVTERRTHERELARANEQLELLNRLLNHDIRNDMAIVDGWVELLRRGDTLDEATDRVLGNIQATAREVVDLTETAGEVVELLAAHAEGDLHAVSLRETLTTEVAKARAAHATATVELSSVPDCAVVADQLLGSVFGNLLSNAVGHNPAPNPQVSVTVDLDDAAGDVRVTVADDGPGVPAAVQESPFERDRKGLESDGTGLGLYLVKRLVERYDGRVWVEETGPTGSVFVVVLRVADRADT